MASSPMRGLNVFIADLRNCKVRDLEEKRINKEQAHIRAKFKAGNLSGYDKKKYICKLLYMYILGYSVDFGLFECVNLLSSPKYSEKQIGYLAITLLLNEHSDMLRLAINTIRKDLEDGHEAVNCLALQAVANICSRDMADALANSVHMLFLSSSSSPSVQKKAALALLRLYQKFPDLVPGSEWDARIVRTLEARNLGVLQCAASLVLGRARQAPEGLDGVSELAVERLHGLVVKHEFPAEYAYYRVAAPWLQVKLLRLVLQFEAPAAQTAPWERLCSALEAILDASGRHIKNAQHSNAQNAVLVEAARAVFHAGVEPLYDRTISVLAEFARSSEMNLRCIGLDTMAALARYDTACALLRHQHEMLAQRLTDRDVSARRRALDVLFRVSDASMAPSVVQSLLEQLPTADPTMREEMALKTAILCEQFAPDLAWYVDTALQLVAVAGDHASEEVWFRIVQIVAANAQLQSYAAARVLASLRHPTCQETMVKLGSFLLGEYGHLAADQPNSAPIDQFWAINSKLPMCGVATRALALGAFLKFANVFPEIRSHLVALFRQYSRVLDAELQQRAVEYLTLLELGDADLLATVCDELPPFPARESALLVRLRQRETAGDAVAAAAAADSPAPATQSLARARAASLVPNPAMPSAAERYAKLAAAGSGVVYEDADVQVGVKMEFHEHTGRVSVFVGNKSSSVALSSATVNLVSADQTGLVVSTASAMEGTVAQQQQLCHEFAVECVNVFSAPPRLTVAFQRGSHAPAETHAAVIPVLLHRFLAPLALSRDDFGAKWAQLGGPPREATGALRHDGSRDLQAALTAARIHPVVLGNGASGEPTTGGAAILYASSLGRIGCLFLVSGSTVTVRASNSLVPAPLLQCVLGLLGGSV